MVLATTPLSAEDVGVATRLMEELERNGRAAEATVLHKLLTQAEASLLDSPWSDDDLSAEDIAEIEQGLADIAAGRVVPHEVVQQGPAAVEAYRRQRNARGVAAPDA